MSYKMLLISLVVMLASCGDDSPESEKQPVSCPSLDETECEASAECSSLRGKRLTEDGCLNAEYAGCIELQACGNAFTYPRDSNDFCWEMPSTCHPVGWEPSPGLPDTCQMQSLGAPDCE